MLSPNYLEGVADDILEIYYQLEDSILKDVVRRIVKTSYITETAKWQLEQLQNAGMVYTDTIKQIAKVTGKSEAALKVIFEDAAVGALHFDNTVYEAAGLSPIPLAQSPAMLQMLTAGLTKTAGSMSNLTLTTANMAQSAYISASNLAYMQVQSGAFSYTQAIREAIKTAAWQGSEVLYPSGHKDKLDVAIRRAVLTGVNQTTAKVSLANAEDMGADLVRVTAHSGARPDHAIWQGKIFSLRGRTETYDDFYITTGYGTGSGLCGWNCRHNFYPYIEGVDEEIYSAADLEEMNRAKYNYNGKKYTEYEISQMQRAMERKIRETRRELIGYDVALNENLFDKLKNEINLDFNAAAVKLKDQEAKLKDLVTQTGFRNKTDRLQVAGFGRSLSQKAVAANKKSLAFSGGSGIINTGGISGTKKTGLWQEKHATLYYKEIQKRKTDHISIAKNTGFSEADISAIKNHIFIAEHRFDDGSVRRFDADFDQAQAWERLIQGPHTDTDILLLKHELEELTLMEEKGLSYEEAHELANKKYNWWEARRREKKNAK